MMVHVLLTILTRKHTINHARPTPNVDMALLDLAEKEASCPPVSVLGADLPYFFWMHRLWRTTIPSTILTSEPEELMEEEGVIWKEVLLESLASLEILISGNFCMNGRLSECHRPSLDCGHLRKGEL